MPSEFWGTPPVAELQSTCCLPLALHTPLKRLLSRGAEELENPGSNPGRDLHGSGPSLSIYVTWKLGSDSQKSMKYPAEGWWGWLLITWLPIYQKNVHELITPSLNITIKLLTTPSRLGHRVLKAKACCGPPCLANKAILFDFTQNSENSFSVRVQRPDLVSFPSCFEDITELLLLLLPESYLNTWQSWRGELKKQQCILPH